jgi:hypothetical protein
MNDRELITGLDACRQASNDLAQPDLRDVAESVASDERAAEIRVRIERIDAAALRAMHNISLPAGLESRLVARLRNAAQPTPAVLCETDSSRTRRRWLAWSAGFAAVVAATIAAVMLLRPPLPLDERDLASSRQWHDQIVAADDWLAIGSGDLDWPGLSKLYLSPRRYRDASSIVGREAYAYDLGSPGGLQATLFVIPQEARAGLSGSPPPQPASFTLGSSIAAWQQGGVIYVVVVGSDRLQDYHKLVRTTPPSAA